MENAAPVKKRKPIALIIVGLLVLVAVVFGIRRLIHSMNYESTDNAQLETFSVPVVSRVAGYVDSIGVNDFARVKSGQALLFIDQRELEVAVAQAEADLLGAQADLETAKASLINSGKNRQVAVSSEDVQKVRLQKAKADLERDEDLFRDGALTRKQVEDSRANYETATKLLRTNTDQVSLAGAQNATSEAQIKRAEAGIAAREAALRAAQLRLSYAKVTAPVNGKVGKVNVRPGQYVQSGQPLFSIVDDEQFWVIANFKETQLEVLKEGQTVDILVDGYPDLRLSGKIVSFSEATGAKFSLLPPDNATGNFVKVTQRVPVRIDIENPAQYKGILKAGLSVKVEVPI